MSANTHGYLIKHSGIYREISKFTINLWNSGKMCRNPDKYMDFDQTFMANSLLMYDTVLINKQYQLLQAFIHNER